MRGAVTPVTDQGHTVSAAASRRCGNPGIQRIARLVSAVVVLYAQVACVEISLWGIMRQKGPLEIDGPSAQYCGLAFGGFVQGV
jgi:hypothetical protein